MYHKSRLSLNKGSPNSNVSISAGTTKLIELVRIHIHVHCPLRCLKRAHVTEGTYVYQTQSASNRVPRDRRHRGISLISGEDLMNMCLV